MNRGAWVLSCVASASRLSRAANRCISGVPRWLSFSLYVSPSLLCVQYCVLHGQVPFLSLDVATPSPCPGFREQKRLRFVFDLSQSMARGNSWDGRLDRMVQTAVMVMEALAGFEHKFHYSLYGVAAVPFASHTHTRFSKRLTTDGL